MTTHGYITRPEKERPRCRRVPLLQHVPSLQNEAHAFEPVEFVRPPQDENPQPCVHHGLPLERPLQDRDIVCDHGQSFPGQSRRPLIVVRALVGTTAAQRAVNIADPAPGDCEGLLHVEKVLVDVPPGRQLRRHTCPDP